MLKIVLFMSMSKDGYIADATGRVMHFLPHQAQHDYGFSTFYHKTDGLIMGSRTYEALSSYSGFAYPDKTTYVITKRPLTSKSQNIHFIHTDIDIFIDELRKRNLEQGAPLQILWLVGGSSLITSFYNQGLIDEYIMTIFPQQFGGGVKCPKAILDQVGIVAIDSKQFNDGVEQRYLLNADRVI